eukprot:SAG31_NODE_8931_length_1362_cov_0.746635_2_plen_92_part_00
MQGGAIEKIVPSEHFFHSVHAATRALVLRKVQLPNSVTTTALNSTAKELIVDDTKVQNDDKLARLLSERTDSTDTDTGDESDSMTQLVEEP